MNGRNNWCGILTSSKRCSGRPATPNMLSFTGIISPGPTAPLPLQPSSTQLFREKVNKSTSQQRFSSPKALRYRPSFPPDLFWDRIVCTVCPHDPPRISQSSTGYLSIHLRREGFASKRNTLRAFLFRWRDPFRTKWICLWLGNSFRRIQGFRRGFPLLRGGIEVAPCWWAGLFRKWSQKQE